MLKKTVTIVNKLGLHARASAKFVSHASRYKSDIEVTKNNHTVNGKSIMGIMMLAAIQGTELELTIEGVDENAMMEDLQTLIDNRFGEAA